MADLYYIEEGYWDPSLGYYVYTADAASTISSSATMAVSVGVIKNGSSALSSVFTQTALASKINGVDLYAFSNAAIAVQVSRIRENNIAVSSSFSIALDYVRFRSAASDSASAFAFTTNIIRGRESSLNLQTAFSFSAEATVLLGVTEATAAFSSAFSQSTTGDRIRFAEVSAQTIATQTATAERQRNFDSQLSSQFTQTALVNKTTDIGLYAFGNAAITALAERTRATEFTANSNFAQTANIERTRTVESSLSSAFSSAIDSQRIRETAFTASSAFGIVAQVERIRDFASALSSSSAISSNIERIQQGASSLSSAFTHSVSAARTRDTAIALTSASSLSCTISHIHGADLVAFSNSTLSALSVVYKIANISLSSNASFTALVSKQVQGNLSLKTSSVLYTSRTFGTGRPWNVTTEGYFANAYGTGVIESIDNNWDAIYKTSKGNSWFFEVIFNVASYRAPTGNRILLTLGPLTVIHTLYRTLRMEIVDSNNNVQAYESQTGTSNGVIENLTQGVDYYLAIFNAGADISTVNAYWGIPGSTINQVGGFRRSGVSDNYDWKTGTTNKIRFPQQANPTNWNARIREVNFRIGDGVAYGLSAANTSFSSPSIPRVNEPGKTKLLLHFANNGIDDTTVGTQSAQAQISSVASISASLSGPVKLPATTLSSNFQLSATIGTLEEITLTAFASGSLTATSLRIQPLASSLSSQFTETATATRIQQGASSQSAAFTQSVPGERTRQGASSQTAAFTQSATAVKTADVVSTQSAQTSLLAVIGTLEEITLSAFTNGTLTATANRTALVAQNLNTSAVIAITPVKQVEASSTQLAQASLNATVFRIKQFALAINAFASQLVVAEELEGTTIPLSAFFHTNKIYIEYDYFDYGYYEEFGIDAQKTTDVLAPLVSAFTLSAATRVSLFAELTATSAASITANVVKRASANFAQTSAVSLSCLPSKTTRYSATLATAFTLEALGNLSSEITLFAFTNATFSATAARTRDYDSDLATAATLFVQTNDSLISPRGANLTSAFAFSVAIDKFRPFSANMAVAASATIDAKKSVEAASGLSAVVNIAVTANKTARAQAAFSSSATLAVTAVKTARVSPAFDVVATQTTTAFRIKQFDTTLSAFASNLTAAVKSVRAVAIFESTATMTVTVAKQVNLTQSLSAAFTQSASATRTRGIAVSLNSQFNKTFNITRLIGIIARLNGVLNFVVAVREIRIDVLVYIIPREDREWTITSETRIRKIQGETRIHKIQGETRQRKVLGETRIYKIRR